MRNHFSKEYKSMNGRYKQQLKNLVNQTTPFEYGWGLEIFVKFLYWMRDYYQLGENVIALEDNEWDEKKKNRPSRLESLNMVLKEYEAWQTCIDKYYQFEHTKDYKQVRHHTYYENKELNEKLCIQEYNMHRNKFFKLIGEYIEDWWD